MIQKGTHIVGETKVHFVRHCEVYNPEHILYARLPNYWLSNKGQEEARCVGKYMSNHPINAVYSSPMARARQTASFIAGGFPNISVQIDERLNEIYTMYEGAPLAELENIKFDLYTDVPPHYENPMDIVRRAREFVNELRQQHAGHEVVAVTHGDVIVFLYLYAKRAELKVHEKGRLMEYGMTDEYPVTGSVNTFIYRSDDPDEIPEYTYVNPH